MRIGIDPSINCTGVCVWDDKNGNHAYYMIPSKCTKKMKEFEHGLVHILPYEKQDAKGLEYSDKETVKFNNIYSIVNKIELIIDHFNPHEVIMAVLLTESLEISRMSCSESQVEWNILRWM